MATVNNLETVKFPSDAFTGAPLYQGDVQLAVPRIMDLIPAWGATSTSGTTVGQLWPRGQRA